ncbi:hypothetical protein H5410_027425, partial [Solanum commersonii]
PIAERPTTSPNVPVCLALKKKVKSAWKGSSQRIAEQFREASLYRPMIQNAKILTAKDKRRGTRPKGGSPSSSAIPTNCAEWITLFDSYKYPFKFCFWLARERGRKTKATKLIAGGIWSTWVLLKRVNPSPFPTHSAQESEWAKAEVVLKAATQCSRETELNRGKLLEREFTPTINRSLGTRPQPIRLGSITIVRS